MQDEEVNVELRSTGPINLTEVTKVDNGDRMPMFTCTNEDDCKNVLLTTRWISPLLRQKKPLVDTRCNGSVSEYLEWREKKQTISPNEYVNASFSSELLGKWQGCNLDQPTYQYTLDYFPRTYGTFWTLQLCATTSCLCWLPR
jgi:hypothetical protein